ncbi:hypothetical protein CWN88_08510 [Vibrio splendidus]|uniref:O-antigen ligase family protein n=1 Tax=Vibrio splendidus TaxID=29497 RepID=UPI000D36CAF7|nr:O-antigen ligase family protein [Vibrio splendidus]PTP03436.1 hypothetical protein CWN88_08510 [Vibrio splendidus]
MKKLNLSYNDTIASSLPVLLLVYYIFLGRKGFFNLYYPEYAFFDSFLAMFLCVILASIRINVIKERKIEILMLYLLVFFIVFGFSGYADIDYEFLYFDKSIRLLSMLVFIMYIPSLSRKDFELFGIVLLILCCISLLYFFLSSGVRGGIAGAGAITTARIFLYSLIFYIVIEFSLKEQVSFKKHVTLFLMVFLGLMATSTRATLILFFIFAIYYFFVFSKGMYKLYSLIILFIISVMLFDSFLSSNVYYRISILFGESGGGSVATRFSYFEEALRLAKDYNYLGSGWGTYGFLSSGIVYFDYPHNIFIEVLLEGGVLSLIAFLLFIMCSSFVLGKNGGLFLVLYFIILSNSLVSGDVYDNRLVFIMPFLSLKLLSLKKRQFIST